MNLDDIHKNIKQNKDFIFSKRFDNSLEKLIERYPEGAPNKLIAQVLLISEEEVERLYSEAVELLRSKMKVEVDEKPSQSALAHS